MGESEAIVNIIDFLSYYDDVRTELKIIVYLQFRIYGNGHNCGTGNAIDVKFSPNKALISIYHPV